MGKAIYNNVCIALSDIHSSSVFLSVEAWGSFPPDKNVYNLHNALEASKIVSFKYSAWSDLSGGFSSSKNEPLLQSK